MLQQAHTWYLHHGFKSTSPYCLHLAPAAVTGRDVLGCQPSTGPGLPGAGPGRPLPARLPGRLAFVEAVLASCSTLMHFIQNLARPLVINSLLS